MVNDAIMDCLMLRRRFGCDLESLELSDMDLKVIWTVEFEIRVLRGRHYNIPSD